MDVMDVTDVKGPRRGSAFHRTMRFVFSSRAGVCALGFLALLVAVSVFAPWLMPYDPNEQDLLNRLQGPSTEHWLGTDSLGRDTLSRLIVGTRVTLLAIVTSVGLAVSLGIPTGLAAGFVGRRLDLVLSWVADILLALPALILALGIVGILGPGLTNAIIAVGIVFAPRFFRVARGSAIALRQETYIEAARATGCSTPRILWRHVLPNVSGSLLVQVSFTAGLAVVAESSLSFLGLGAAPPTATWGSILRDAFDNIYTTSFPVIPPAVVIVLTVMATAVLGDVLRDALGRQVRVAS